MTDDPFAVLGLDADATPEDIRDARRRLAKQHHPDRGGDPDRMRVVNEAADAALTVVERAAHSVETAESDAATEAPAGKPTRRDDDEPTGGRVARDVPSFTVEALPVETFEGLLVVASWLGEVLDDEPPYRLDTYLTAPLDCWCRLDVVPDAGASTVSLTVAGLDGAPAPAVTAVRDAWVDGLNRIDWP